MNYDDKKKLIKGILYGTFFIVVFFMLLFSFSSRWALGKWGGLTMDEIIYHLKAPLEGTGDGLIKEYIIKCIVPVVIILFMISLIIIFVHKWKKLIVGIVLLGSSLYLFISVFQFWSKLNITNYIEAQRNDTLFIEEHYVDPRSVSIEFPKEKRNLIFIYLESMEVTYANEKNGGNFKSNYIPELTKLAQKNEDFSGKETKLNGAYVMPATSWTMGAIFGHTAGLPLQLSIDGNAMDTQNTFFPNMESMGDILEQEGYKQIFMIGSDATFGGRRLYFTEHGSYEMFDYKYVIEESLLPQNYKEFWGYEDKKLFSFAKEKLLELAKEEAPFNLTLLTVDTHAEDGYICEDCDNSFGDDQYANVIACSSKKVSEFLTWVEQQEFYKNTTIVLIGDHLTMDTDFCSDIESDYDRKVYVNYINSACEPENKGWKRTYTTFDTFPTTLASIGVAIEGNRLGLGTNLFSSEKTLAEQYSLDYVVGEVYKKSEFIEQLANIDQASDIYLKRIGKFPTASVEVLYKEETSSLALSVSNVMNLENLDRVEVELSLNDTNEINVIPLEKIEENYVIELDWILYQDSSMDAGVYVVDNTGRRFLIEELPKDFSLYTNNFSEYLTVLKEKEDCTIFLAVKDEASMGLSPSWKLKLKELGLKENLSKEIRSSYYAIISNGIVLSEKMGQEALQEEGSINQEKDFYSIFSAGYNAGAYCSIKINEEEYAMNERGINIVVYDNVNACVLDSVCFDTFDGKLVYRDNHISEIIKEETVVAMQLANELQINNFNAYINYLKEQEDYTIFIVAKDEASTSFTNTMQASLKSLGLKETLIGKFRYSYYAVIDQGNIQEKIGLEKLEGCGILKNGTTIYEVVSAGFDCGCIASVKLNNQEFAMNSIGLNIVVYDNNKNCVVDTVCFNTFSGDSVIRINGESTYE